MKTTSNPMDSVNQAIESKRMDRDKPKNVLTKDGKYTVKLKDEHGREYVVRYFF